MKRYGLLTSCFECIVAFAAITITCVASTKIVNIGPCVMVKDGTCPDNENVKFHLYTSSNPTTSQRILLTNATTMSAVDATHPNKIIIHGSSNMNHPGLIQIRQAYLSSGNYNVIVVDYATLTTGPDFPCYITAVYNAPHAAHCIAQLVQWLRKTGTDDIHVLGYSLGAQVASLVANILRPYKLKRITGLDPARPLYEMTNNFHTLDAGDALFVDVLHTNGLLQGKVMRSGHVDFYMNGGFVQPGCGNSFLEAAGCSHSRAPIYFAESILSNSGFWGWPCDGYISSIFQLCQPNGESVLMGEHVPHSARGFIYVNTSSEVPFALGPELAV